MPRTGILSALAIAQAGSAGIASNNNQETHTSWMANASSSVFSKFSDVLHCTLYHPKEPALWGVNPKWPITIIHASTIALILSMTLFPHSSFIASHQASLTKRRLFFIASSHDVS
jgi:hypothetical protein